MRLCWRLHQESYNLWKFPVLSTSEETNIQFSGTTIKSSQCKKLSGMQLIFDGKLDTLKINTKRLIGN